MIYLSLIDLKMLTDICNRIENLIRQVVIFITNYLPVKVIRDEKGTIFFFQKRSKTWGMIDLNGDYKPMSENIHDQDGGWWNHVKKELKLNKRLNDNGKVVATADCIIFCKPENKMLLIKRGKEPFKGKWAFPGGRIDEKDDDIITAAYRELREETGIKDVELGLVKTIGNNKRDPRGFCITSVFVGCVEDTTIKAKAGDDAVDCMWFDLDDLPDMAFDHRDIVSMVKISGDSE